MALTSLQPSVDGGEAAALQQQPAAFFLTYASKSQRDQLHAFLKAHGGEVQSYIPDNTWLVLARPRVVELALADGLALSAVRACAGCVGGRGRMHARHHRQLAAAGHGGIQLTRRRCTMRHAQSMHVYPPYLPACPRHADGGGAFTQSRPGVGWGHQRHF